MATWNTEVMAVQNGTEVVTGATDITEHEVLASDTAGYKTKFTAKGTSGSEIGFVYVVNDDGTYGEVFTQGTSASGKEFTYTTSSKIITMPTAVTGRKIACAYTRATAAGAQRISIEADKMPKTVLATCYGLAKDVCSGDLYPCQVEGVAQIDGDYTFELAADGEPSVHSLNMEFVRGCGSKKLYDFTVYTEEE